MIQLLRFLICVSVSFLLSGLAVAQSAKKSECQLSVRNIGAYGDREALVNCQAAVKEYPNDPELQYLLGTVHRVRFEYSEAMKWLRLAAESGNASAMSDIGNSYFKGQGLGVTKDYAEAMKWFRLAADKGSAHGMVNVGVMYNQGAGVVKDQKEAKKWFLRAEKLKPGIARQQLASLPEHLQERTPPSSGTSHNIKKNVPPSMQAEYCARAVESCYEKQGAMVQACLNAKRQILGCE